MSRKAKTSITLQISIQLGSLSGYYDMRGLNCHEKLELQGLNHRSMLERIFFQVSVDLYVSRAVWLRNRLFGVLTTKAWGLIYLSLQVFQDIVSTLLKGSYK